ncbi:DUF4376 domain-containing protein [Acidovorax sp.]|uniref:DUF4376 domain-containing protein n=1 Tax=Acidovorax sp. TaxID=1872122 RepID=UPI003D06A17E
MPFAKSNNGVVDHVLQVNPATIWPPATAALYRAASEGVAVGWLDDGQAFTAPPAASLGHRQAAAWERIKAERDRRKVLGVKVGAHWFHSDDSSRIQQLALMMMGAGIPPGLQWKTLTTTPPPVFVTMTQALAAGIFQATAASDAAIFQACEVHRVAMEASGTPEAYDFSGGWPASIEDGA